MLRPYGLWLPLCCALWLAPLPAAAQETDMPKQAGEYLEQVLLTVRTLQETPKDISTSASYDGEENVKGQACYVFTVYASLSERYENLGSYAVTKDGKTLYAYDVVKDAYKVVTRGYPPKRQ